MFLSCLRLLQVFLLVETVCCCRVYDLERRMTQVAQNLRTNDVESLFYFVRLNELSSRFGVELPFSLETLRCSMIGETYDDPKRQLMARFVLTRLKCPTPYAHSVRLDMDDPELVYLTILQNDDMDANAVPFVKSNNPQLAKDIFQQMTSMNRTESLQAFSFLALSLDSLYPTLDRSLRSRFSPYRSYVNEYLVAQTLPVPSSSVLAFLRLCSVGASFSPLGIDPPVSLQRRKQLMQFVLSLQERTDPKLQFFLSFAVFGFHRQMDFYDVVPHIIYAKEQLSICLTDSVGNVVGQRSLVCSVDEHPQVMTANHTCFYSDMQLAWGTHSVHLVVSNPSGVLLDDRVPLSVGPNRALLIRSLLVAVCIAFVFYLLA